MLASQHLEIPAPYGLEKPKAVHYFGVLQEIGSNHISQVKIGNLMGWRKEKLPKSGDTGHVLIIDGQPEKISESRYKVQVVDSTKRQNGLARRSIYLQTSSLGQIIGVQLHEADQKIKRTAIYHAPLISARYCWGCGVPQKVCLCGQVQASISHPNLLILRHPDERKKTLSTVSLVKQRYPNLLVKEGSLFAPLRDDNLALVFPNGKTQSKAMVTSRADKTLIIIDATWRKAKRMLHDNPWLNHLPRVSIDEDKLSDYLLRKVPNETALSTVETVAFIMQDGELSKLFKSFMDTQIEIMGLDKYHQNYQGHLNYSNASDDSSEP